MPNYGRHITRKQVEAALADAEESLCEFDVGSIPWQRALGRVNVLREILDGSWNSQSMFRVQS